MEVLGKGSTGPRLASLDAFRGFAIASMVLVNNPGDWGHLHPPLAHAAWNGWTFTDTVFPFFLFAAGMAMALSLARRRAAGEAGLVAGLARRSLVIFLVGLALNLVPSFSFGTVRIPGVLQRIALCILVAAPFAVHARTRTIGLAILALFVAYSVPMLLMGELAPGRDFGASIDRQLLAGHLWSQSKTWDPEGLWSTLPAVASLLFGVITGRWLSIAQPGLAAAGRLLAAGVAAVLAGLALDQLLMPINKNLWTPSYSVFMTGLALIGFAVFHAALDGASSGRTRALARRAALPLTIFGMNALFLFAFSGLVSRLLAPAKPRLYAPIKDLPLSAENASLAYALAFWLAMFAVAWFLWRKKWFIKA